MQPKNSQLKKVKTVKQNMNKMIEKYNLVKIFSDCQTEIPMYLY